MQRGAKIPQIFFFEQFLIYYHKMLEAKIVLSDNIVMSLGTEFIENEKEDVEKQDCEINAAKRLLEKIKKDYPRLPVCIQGGCIVCGGKHHGTLQGKVSLGVSFHAERSPSESAG